MNRNFSHTFSICAYKESKHLESCIISLKSQLLPSKIIICTSTPNDHIKGLAKKYNLPLFVREGKSNIKDDWNFAYNTPDTDLVTVAHQDDVYNSRYASSLKKMVEKRGDDFTLYFTKYKPAKNGFMTTDINSIIRNTLNARLRFDRGRYNKKTRISTLAFGNSICCPSATYNKRLLGENVFSSPMNFDIDWDTFLKLAKLDHPFLYNPKVLTYYRIHPEATSMTFINNKNREIEDTAMFEKFWSKTFSKIIMIFYKKAYDTYRSKEAI